MKKFAIGLAMGLAIGAAMPVAAASLVGGNGYLHGWTVSVNGDEVCDTPYIWSGTREIECD